MCRTPNNIYLSNYSFLWAEYFKYEKFLFLFFYKYKFWVVSTKMMFLSQTLMLIFCNYYRLRPYYNNKPVRKKKRAFYDPDGQPRSFNFIKYFDRIFFKRFVLKYTKFKFQKILLKRNSIAKHYNRRSYRLAGRYLRPLRRWISSLKKRKLYIVNKKIKNGIHRYIARKINYKLLKRLKKTQKLKKLRLLRKRYTLKKKAFIHFIRRRRPLVAPSLLLLTIIKDYAPRFAPRNLLGKRNVLKNFKVSKIYHNSAMHIDMDEEQEKFDNNKFLATYNIEQKSLSFGPAIKFFLISDKMFFFHLKRILKCIFFKKNLDLKLRNIENLIPYKVRKWEDALRTAFLIQFKKKHFIRTIFRDFSYLNKIAYLEMDAQLFAKIIINMFEMTKFHRRLIYLLKSVFETLSKFYKHIHCKIKMKGKMQYKKRTKTIYIFKQVVIPLNRLFINVEYGKGPANTPFGVLGIKTWLYYVNYQYKTQNKYENIISDNQSLKTFEEDTIAYPEALAKKRYTWEIIENSLIREDKKQVHYIIRHYEELIKFRKFQDSIKKNKKKSLRFIKLKNSDNKNLKIKEELLLARKTKIRNKYMLNLKQNINYVKKKN